MASSSENASPNPELLDPKELAKIVYFDSGSALDYIQLQDGGKYEMTIQDESDGKNSRGVNASAEGSATVKAGLFDRIQARGGVSGSASWENSEATQRVEKSFLTNTVLSDLFEVTDRFANGAFTVFRNCEIEQIPGSIASFSVLAPYMRMLSGSQPIDGSGLSVAIDRLAETLSSAKGYLEFLGHPQARLQEGKSTPKSIILRFNADAFVNNYSPNNILQMNLCVCAVKVGSRRLSDIEVNHELELASPSKTVEEPHYQKPVAAPSDDEEPLDMYDVLLAGVTVND